MSDNSDSFCCIPTTQLSLSMNINKALYFSGDKAYLVIYFINPYEEFGNYDYDKEKYIYTSYKKASGVISLIYE